MNARLKESDIKKVRDERYKTRNVRKAQEESREEYKTEIKTDKGMLNKRQAKKKQMGNGAGTRQRRT